MKKAQRDAISKSAIGNNYALGNKGMRGRKFTQEHKDRIAAAQRKRWKRVVRESIG